MLGRPVTTGSSLLRLSTCTRRVAPRFASYQGRPNNNQIFRVTLLPLQRSYATPGRPRSTVGEPSKTVKRAVKREAKTTDGGEAKRQNASRKKTAKPKARAKAKRAPRTLTPEQQAKKDSKLVKEKIAKLKKTALSPPATPTNVSAYQIFFTEKMKGANISSVSVIGDLSRNTAQQWRSITPAEQEHYNHLAAQERERRVAEYKRWVESYTTEQIAEANRARKHLNRIDSAGHRKKAHYTPIHDERAPKRPVTAYIQFTINRQASGDFKNIGVSERAKLLSQEWKALTDSEKQKYKDLSSQDLSRYTTEYTSAYGERPAYQQATAAV